MKNNSILKFGLIVILLSINFLNIKYVYSNPAPVQLFYYAGVFIPNEDNNMTLFNANVVIDANTSDFNSLGELYFNGSYTIFNDGEFVNMTIAAPFNFFPTNECVISVNGTSTPYILYYSWDDESEVWESYLVNRTEFKWQEHFWLLCNITIPAKSSLQISYIFKLSENEYYPKWGNYYIIYDVGTSRVWNGNITEDVSINIHGNLPDTIYNEEKCIIKYIGDGKCYSWNWDNERINVDYVGVSYYFGSPPSYLDIFSIIITCTIIGLLIIAISFALYYYLKRKNRTTLSL